MCFFLYRYGYVWRNRKSGQHPGYGCHQQWQLVSHGPSLAPLALKMDDPKGNSPIRILLAEEVGAVNQSWPWQWTMGNWNVWRQAALTYPAPQHSVKETSTAVGCATELCRDRLPWQTLLFNILPRILPQLQLLSCAETGCCDRPCSSTFYQGYCPSCPSGSEKQPLPKHLCACTGCGFNMHRFFMQWFTVELFFLMENSVCMPKSTSLVSFLPCWCKVMCASSRTALGWMWLWHESMA